MTKLWFQHVVQSRTRGRAGRPGSGLARASVVREGTWTKESTVDVDWRSLGLVVLTGCIVDAQGKPLANVQLIPVEARGTDYHLPDPIGETDGDGRFRVLMPKNEKLLLAIADGYEAYAQGPFQKDAEVVLVAAK